MKMEIKCSWCGKYMGEADIKEISGLNHNQSDGICDSCSKELIKKSLGYKPNDLKEFEKGMHVIQDGGRS